MSSPVRTGMKRKASEDVEDRDGKAFKVSKPDDELNNDVTGIERNERATVDDGKTPSKAAPSESRTGMKRKADDDREYTGGKTSEWKTVDDNRSQGDTNKRQKRAAKANTRTRKSPAPLERPEAEKGVLHNSDQPSNNVGAEGEDDDATKARLLGRRREAGKLLKHLVLLFETQRINDQLKNLRTLKATQAHLTTVCELATQPDMASNCFCDMLPVTWFSSMKEVQDALNDHKELEGNLHRCISGLNLNTELFNTAILERSEILLEAGDEDPYPESAKVLDSLIQARRKVLQQAEERIDSLEEQIHESWVEMQKLCKEPLKTAEEALYVLDILPRLEPTPEKKAGNPPPPTPRERPPEAARSRVGGKGPAKQPTRDIEANLCRPYESARPEHMQHDHRAARPKIGDEAPPRNDLRTQKAADPPKLTMREETRQWKRQHLEDARKVRDEASRALYEHRDHYRNNLIAFLRVTKEEGTNEPKEDFDNAYFLAQSRFTHELEIAEKRVEFAKDQAKKARAIPNNKQTSDYGDWTDDGYDAWSEQEEDLIWELQREGIENWLQEDRTQDVLSQDGTYDEQQNRVGSDDSGFGADPEYMSYGKRERRLNEWKEHCEQLRADPELSHIARGPDEVVVKRKDVLSFEEGICCGG